MMEQVQEQVQVALMEKAVQRWIVDISKWNPSPQDFSLALSLLPRHEHSHVTRFMRTEDRKAALVSRLLQYTLVHHLLGIPFHEIVINRTLEGKPYLETRNFGLEFPNFNFNVTHHGDYVAIASEPLCLVGVDIVSCIKPHYETIPQFIQNFSSYFTSLEWDNVLKAGTDDEVLVDFYRYWCLKEAFVKAVGSGLGYGLERVEFRHTNWTNISVKIDGKCMVDWRFWLFELPKKHWVAVARGPPGSAAENYKRTLRRTEFDEDEYQKGLYLPNGRFVSQTIEQLFRRATSGDDIIEQKNILN